MAYGLEVYDEDSNLILNVSDTLGLVVGEFTYSRGYDLESGTEDISFPGARTNHLTAVFNGNGYHIIEAEVVVDDFVRINYYWLGGMPAPEPPTYTILLISKGD